MSPSDSSPTGAASRAALEPGEAHHDNHGQTPAAWTAVIIITIAFAVGTIGLMVGSWITFWVGAGLVVVGALVGKVMQMMGLGATPRTGHQRST